MPTNATIKIDADTGNAQTKLDRMRNSAKGTADEFGRAGKNAKTLGGEIGKMGEGMIKSMVGMSAIVSAMRKAIDAAEQVRKTQVAATEKRQGAVISAGSAIGSLARSGKLSKDDQAALFDQAMGATDREGAAGLLQSLSEKGMKDRRFRSRLTGDTLRNALVAQDSGVFKQNEIEDYIDKGKRFDIGERLAALPEEAQAALRSRRETEMLGRGKENVSARELALEASVKKVKEESVLAAFTPEMLLRAKMRSDRRTGIGDDRWSMNPTGPLLSGFDFGELKDLPVRVINQPAPRPQMSGDNQSER